MNRYEIMYIIAAALEDERKEAVIDTVNGIIEDGGEVVKTEIMGLRRLAYPIQKHADGVYSFITFSAENTAPAEIEGRLRIMENVLRFLIIRQED